MEINYERCNVSQRIQREIVHAKGQAFWEELTHGLLIPTDDMEAQACSACTRVFMRSLAERLPAPEIQAILVRVRHDLRRDDFDWAVRLFQQIGDIDRFADEVQRIGIDAVVASFDQQEDYFGQNIDHEVLDFVHSVPNLFYGKRYGNEILAQAIPCDVSASLHPVNANHKRRALCHCHFARESFLQPEGPVSPLLCACSLGHTMALWEAVFDCELEGEVVESALMGSDRCLFRIHLPEEVVHRWTRGDSLTTPAS